MKVLILAAGYGTRLYPIIKDTPKALLPIAGKPILEYILEKVRDFKDLKQVYIVTNHKFFSILTDWVKEYQSFPVTISVINDGTRSPEDRLGSVGDIDFILKNEKVKDDLLVIGGDNLFDFPLDDYIQFSKEKSGHVSIGAYDIGNIKDAGKFGVVVLDQDNRISSFEEKPQEPKSSLIAMCLYYFPQALFGLVDEYLKSTQKSDQAGEYIKWLCSQKGVYGFKFEGKWYDIGSIESYEEAEKAFAH